VSKSWQSGSMGQAKERRPLSKGEWAAVALAAVVVAVAAYLWLRSPPQPARQEPKPAAEASAEVRPAAEEPAPQVSDAQARASLEALSTNPLFRRWLAAGDDLLGRWVVVTDNLAEGVSPRKALELCAPRGAFKVAQRGGKAAIAPDSYARYDDFAGVVASIDAAAFARIYRALRPALQGAYRALGYPNGNLDVATSRALARLEAAPVVDGEVQVVPDRGLFLYADPKLEGLRAVEKHLLRMGPRNTRMIQAKARELRLALAFPAEAATGK
jgi:hypothetical protein